MSYGKERFKLASPFQLRGDQPEAVNKLTEWIQNGADFTTLLGVTGSEKLSQWLI